MAGEVMTYTKILFDVHDYIATVTMNAPERLNAMDEVMHRDLADVWNEINDREDIRVAVVTGAGRAFCTGADVREAAGSMTAGAVGPKRWVEGGDFVAQYAKTGLRRYQGRGMPVTLRGLPGKPLIAAVNGMCAGGGLHFVCMADFAIAASDASFFDPHVNVSIVPAQETLETSRTLPRSAALAIAFLGLRWRMDANRAYELGFVTEVVPPEDLIPRALELAEAIVSDTSPLAVQATKAGIWMGMNLPAKDASVFNRVMSHQAVQQSDDVKEGVSAYFEDRKPVWRGR